LGFCQSLKNIRKLNENEKPDEFKEENAYGEYVAHRLKYIENPIVKQSIKQKIDNIFYVYMKKSSQENTKL